jgi:hypothetical protein
MEINTGNEDTDELCKKCEENENLKKYLQKMNYNLIVIRNIATFCNIESIVKLVDDVHI